jgi:hypothetical protein
MPVYPGAPPAWIRTKVHATTLSPVSYEPWFESMVDPSDVGKEGKSVSLIQLRLPTLIEFPMGLENYIFRSTE